jgi:hypothetical protein
MARGSGSRRILMCLREVDHEAQRAPGRSAGSRCACAASDQRGRAEALPSLGEVHDLPTAKFGFEAVAEADREFW